MSTRPSRVAILADSRGFDTYYLNDAYPAGYGYHETFAHLLARALWRKPELGFEAVHIPDHFRGGSVESNVLRLALTDPAVVVLLNGIWETLLHKGHFLDYAKRKMEAFDTRSGGTLDLTYNSRTLADLFLADELTVSPRKFAERERRIISYFRRRRRGVAYLTLPVPGPEHLNRLHYAGNHRLLPEWGECLAAINAVMAPLAKAYGATVLDLDALMRAKGGPGACLIDQWHFSPAFHAAVAQALLRDLGKRAKAETPACPAAADYILPGALPAEPVLVHGAGPAATEFLHANPGLQVEAVVLARKDRSTFQSVPVVGEKELDRTKARVLVLCAEPGEGPAAELRLLKALPADRVILLPEETRGIVNPLVRGAEG